MKATVVAGYKNQINLAVADTDKLSRDYPDTVLPLGATKYESKHGVGTTSGHYPLSATRSANLQIGDVVEITGIVRILEISKAPPWARKIFIMRTQLLKKGADLLKEETAAKAEAEKVQKIQQEALRALEEGRFPLAPPSELSALLPRGYGGIRIAWDSVFEDLKQLSTTQSRNRFAEQLKNLACILKARNKPTLAYRGIPKRWIQSGNADESSVLVDFLTGRSC